MNISRQKRDSYVILLRKLLEPYNEPISLLLKFDSFEVESNSEGLFVVTKIPCDVSQSNGHSYYGRQLNGKNEVLKYLPNRQVIQRQH